MDLLTNATVVDDAIRFVSQKDKEKLKVRERAVAYDQTKRGCEVTTAKPKQVIVVLITNIRYRSKLVYSACLPPYSKRLLILHR
jgi:hypothetical protein